MTKFIWIIMQTSVTAICVDLLPCCVSPGGDKKPGNCPYVPPGTLGICINGCNGDDMCDGDEKCCSNGCGAMCMKPGRWCFRILRERLCDRF